MLLAAAVAVGTGRYRYGLPDATDGEVAINGDATRDFMPARKTKYGMMTPS